MPLRAYKIFVDLASKAIGGAGFAGLYSNFIVPEKLVISKRGWLDIIKGHGFITRDAGGDVFVHYTALPSQEGFRSLVEGERVEFSIEEREKGPAAIGVRKL